MAQTRYLIENIHVPYGEDGRDALVRAVAQATGSKDAAAGLTVWRRALDVRAKNNLRYTYSVLVDAPGKAEAKPIVLEPVVVPHLERPPAARPVVIGFGPAGIFAAYCLAQAGARPLVLERGPAVAERVALVNGFWKGGELDPEGNVQFGEGGAGTFSDGKLTARGKDPLARHILELLVEHGARPDILFEAKAHIGTDVLRELVPRLRHTIVELGGEVRFGARVDEILVDDGRVGGVVLAGGERIVSPQVILAIGHSARDTFSMLARKGVQVEPKPFAVGVRIEHPQELINRITYGPRADFSRLPAAEYVLKNQVDGRGCYSFCMCPGGQIVNASSETDGLVVNGMSLAARGSPWANSALVVNVLVEDFHRNDALDGIAFQREIERACLHAGGGRGRAPATDLAAFLRDEKPLRLPKTSFLPAVTPARLPLPGFVRKAIAHSAAAFDRTLHGFVAANPVLIAPETRTSSPVRIVRDPATLQSVSVRGLYPSGEGAGYAGGIVSAAVDGWRAANALVDELAAQG